VVSDLTTVTSSQAREAAASAGTVGTTLSDGMADAMNGYDWNTTGSTVMSDIVSGFESAGGDLSQVGEDVAAGIGEGEAAHDFSGDAGTTIDNDETALRNAADSHSPAARFNPFEWNYLDTGAFEYRADKVLADGKTVGMSTGRIISWYYRRMIFLATIDPEYAKIGTEVVVLWGDPGTRQKEIRATVTRYPYHEEGRNDTVDVSKIPSGIRK